MLPQENKTAITLSKWNKKAEEKARSGKKLSDDRPNKAKKHKREESSTTLMNTPVGKGGNVALRWNKKANKVLAKKNKIRDVDLEEPEKKEETNPKEPTKRRRKEPTASEKPPETQAFTTFIVERKNISGTISLNHCVQCIGITVKSTEQIRCKYLF